jgi:hypothetical protein|uniref:Uncharacterized protein n=1 Tax=Mus musculus TaxID=10090 RepID=Q3TUC9_MOUSE|nr:unnamed protein product [Mus musculus]
MEETDSGSVASARLCDPWDYRQFTDDESGYQRGQVNVQPGLWPCSLSLSYKDGILNTQIVSSQPHFPGCLPSWKRCVVADRLSSHLGLPGAGTGLGKGGGDSLGALGNLGHTAVCLFNPLHLPRNCWHHRVPEAPTPVNRSLTFL